MSDLVCVLYPNCEYVSTAHRARSRMHSSAVVWSGLCLILNRLIDYSAHMYVHVHEASMYVRARAWGRGYSTVHAVQTALS